jgi:acyl transferase domain-containing protein
VRWDPTSHSNSPSAGYGSFRQFCLDRCGLSRVEASAVDPQQLMLLGSTTEVLSSVRGTDVGVFVGMGALTAVSGIPGGDAVEVSIYAGTSALLSVASGRISFMRGLIGPCLTLDTACCSTLVTKHLARKSLESVEC